MTAGTPPRPNEPSPAGDGADGGAPRARRPGAGQGLALVLLVALLVGLGLYASLTERPFGMALTHEGLSGWVRSLGAWGGAGIVALMVLHSFVPFPAEIVTFIAGHQFGIAWGTVYAWTGAMLGASVAFMLARQCGRACVERFVPTSLSARLDAWSQEHSATALLVARFIPVIAFNLINYAVGLTRVGWWTFLWTTGLGILPLTLLFVSIGERMQEATARDWLLLGAGAVIVWIAGRLLRRWREGRSIHRRAGHP